MNTHVSPTRFRPEALLMAMALLAFALGAAKAADYQPPDFMNFQGYLEAADGRPYGYGTPETRTLIFKIYKDPTSTDAADLIWAERQVVTLDNGHFSVQFGAGDQEASLNHGPLADVFKNNVASDRYLGITVEGVGNEISPRLRFLTAPYAHLASQANKLINPATGAEFDPFNPTVATSISSPIQSIGGNARGTGATDLQVARSADTQVASGNHSVLGGGIGNTAGAGESVVVGGRTNNIASGSGNFIGGGELNNIDSSTELGAIVGGGENHLTSVANYSFIGAGLNNESQASYTVTPGGKDNLISNGSDYTVVAGGLENQIFDLNSDYALIAGGYRNQANRAYAVVGGGALNTNSGLYSTISGGTLNVSSGGTWGTIGGGRLNFIGGDYSSVASGRNNTNSGNSAIIGGGYNNGIDGDYGTISGGRENSVSGPSATVSGGRLNQATGDYAAVGGGQGNVASGHTSTIPGGNLCAASATFSFAAGNRAKANHQGAFVWADSSGFDFASATDNQFNVRATGGVRLVTGVDGSGNPTAGATLAAGGESWGTVSDRNRKKDFSPLEAEQILDQLDRVPVTTWRYDWEDGSSVKHIGPVAQDFKQAFFPGRDDKVITTLEMDGVALAAIKGLKSRVEKKSQRIDELESENESLKQTLNDLLKRVRALESKDL